MPPPAGRWYLPEIHDVHPGMQDRLDALIALFPADAAGRIAFSVVPNWQGRAPVDADPGFAARLRALPGVAVLHGWTHSLGPSLPDWLLYGHDNRSEFRRLSEAEAGARLDAGIAMLGGVLGAVPRWFCAPRWQQSAGASAALRARGFAGWMTVGALVPATGAPVPLPALNFDEGERRWKVALAALARGPRREALVAGGRPFRFVLHPGDLDHPPLVAEIRALSARLSAGGWRAVDLPGALRQAAA